MFANPRNQRIAWLIIAIVLGTIIVIDLFVHHHAHFEKDGLTFDTLPEFYPLFGFTSALVLIIFAKIFGIAMKRKDTHYADD